MVKGKSQNIRNPPNKKCASVASKQASTSSPAAPPNKTRSTKSMSMSSIPSCSACGIVISEDVKALQCDRCLDGDKWKCAECLNLTADMYDHLVSDPQCSLRWFCTACDKVAMDTKMGNNDCQSDKIDSLITLVEKLLEKLAGVETRINEKCDVEVIAQLDSRLKALEDRSLQHEQEVAGKLSSIENKVKTELDAKVHMTASADLHQESSALQQRVQEVVNKKLEQDRDVEKRRKNIVIYRVPEVNTDSVTDRNESDLAFITELLDSVFGMKQDQYEITRIFRLGRRDESSDTPRPLLLELGSLDAKESVMSNLKKLKDAQAPFKGISLSHDLTPWQRAEIKKMVEEAKQDHINSSSEGVENFIFRVVGQGSAMRVIKVRKHH